jgi:hypothetical protein
LVVGKELSSNNKKPLEKTAIEKPISALGLATDITSLRIYRLYS